MVNKDIVFSKDKPYRGWFLCCYPLAQCASCFYNIVYICIYRKSKDCRKGYDPLNEDEQPKNDQRQISKTSQSLNSPQHESLTFNTQALFVTFIWGIPLVGTVAFLLSAFYKLPVASYLLPIYLLNAFQVFIVVITLLITYKVLQITEPEIRTFMKSMRAAYSDHVEDNRKVKEKCRVVIGDDEVKDSGRLFGEMVGVVIHELPKNTTSLHLSQEIPNGSQSTLPSGATVTGSDSSQPPGANKPKPSPKYSLQAEVHHPC